jgi:hypothetical protein
LSKPISGEAGDGQPIFFKIEHFAYRPHCPSCQGEYSMGFFSGRATFVRFRVDGLAPSLFGPEHLEKLDKHAIGKQKTTEKDGTEVGWIASDDILDLGFDLAKNVVNDILYCCIRIDTQKLPADLLRSYARTEIEALAAQNPSGRPSIFQKRQAREAAREKLEAEAQDGRFIRRKAYPVLWDRLTNCLLVGTSSPSVLDRVRNLFQETIGGGIVLVDAGQRAGLGSHAASLADVRSASFVPATNSSQVAWVADPSSVNFLGNEFLLWLWFVLETAGDTIRLGDESNVAVMLGRSLVLDCPREVSGNETIRSDAPTKLPEARRAIQAGKLPRQTGMILVRHDQQYELTLQAETFAVSGAKLPTIDEKDDRIRREERIGQIRHLIETVDLLFDAFLKRRLTTDWPQELRSMQRWLEREERSRLAEAG